MAKTQPCPCTSCGKITSWVLQGRGWCNACYRRWSKAGKPASGPPPDGRHSPARPCSSCGKISSKLRRSWCGSCYQRWIEAGKPSDGPPPKSRPDRVRACAYCGKVDRIQGHGWCNGCYTRWLTAGKPDAGPPPLQVHAPRSRPCLACGEIRVIRGRGWCGPCHGRWLRAGKPESGPPTVAVKWRGSLEEGICTACGESEMVYSNRGWCRACDMRWYSAGQPEGGPPPLKQARNGRRVRRCSQCGVVARIWGRELCQDCYLRYRQPIAYKQRVEQMEKLSLKRILWAIEKPGEPNPFQCVAPGCTETGDPFTYHLCRVHYRRLCIYGTYELPGEPRPAA